MFENPKKPIAIAAAFVAGTLVDNFSDSMQNLMLSFPNSNSVSRQITNITLPAMEGYSRSMNNQDLKAITENLIVELKLLGAEGTNGLDTDDKYEDIVNSKLLEQLTIIERDYVVKAVALNHEAGQRNFKFLKGVIQRLSPEDDQAILRIAAKEILDTNNSSYYKKGISDDISNIDLDQSKINNLDTTFLQILRDQGNLEFARRISHLYSTPKGLLDEFKKNLAETDLSNHYNHGILYCLGNLKFNLVEDIGSENINYIINLAIDSDIESVRGSAISVLSSHLIEPERLIPLLTNIANDDETDITTRKIAIESLKDYLPVEPGIFNELFNLTKNNNSAISATAVFAISYHHTEAPNQVEECIIKALLSDSEVEINGALRAMLREENLDIKHRLQVNDELKNAFLRMLDKLEPNNIGEETFRNLCLVSRDSYLASDYGCAKKMTDFIHNFLEANKIFIDYWDGTSSLVEDHPLASPVNLAFKAFQSFNTLRRNADSSGLNSKI